MWNGTSDQTSKNYMYGDKIFILDEINSENCAFLIGDLTTFVLNEQNQGKSLSIIINSPGGEALTLFTILGLLNTARLHDITISTFVLGTAASAASLLAACGDKRYISKLSNHMIHFGTVWSKAEKYSEIDKICYQTKEYADSLIDTYIEACGGKLTKKKLAELESDERGYVNAKDCIELGLADEIIEEALMSKLDYDSALLSFHADYSKALEKSKSKVRKGKWYGY